MRQGNGSELPGITPSDPRSQSIGIIDVSPTDDRKSVLAGILTQEKLNRKQIAVILPAQNKAFQRPQDFDDLKSIRRKLQAEIVFIVPGGPGLAEFARQRRFPVYSTLESFADALQSEANNPPPVKRKSSGLFGGSRSKVAGAGAAGAIVGAAGAERLNNPGPAPVSVAPQSAVPAPIPPDAAVPSKATLPPPSTPRRSRPLAPPTPIDEDVIETQPQKRSGSTAAAAAAGAGAGFLAADLLQHKASASAAATPSIDNQDDWDLPPVQSGPRGQSPTPYAAVPNSGPISPLPPTPPPSASVQNNPDATPAQGESVPGIIDLPRTKRSTNKLPVGGPGAAAESVAAGSISTQPPATPPSTPPVRGAGGRRSSGYIPAAVGGAVVGAAAGAAIGAEDASAGNAIPPGAVKSSRIVGLGAFPPQRVNSGSGRRGSGRQRRRRGIGFWVIAALLLLLASLLICSFVWDFASPSSFSSTMHNIVPNISNSAASTPATVTITPNSEIVQDNYLVHAVPTATPDAALHQVTLRTVSFKTPDLTKPVTGTGKTVTVGVAAIGKIQFSNGSFSDYSVAANTAFHVGGGVDVATDRLITVPAAKNINGSVVGAPVSVTAHATQPGTSGNIVAGTVNVQGCCGSAFILAISTAFTGGQDPQNYSFIKTTDVSSVVDPQKAQLLAAGQKGVHDQIKANEQMAKDITCTLGQSVDQTVGSATGGRSITSANVTLAETCTAQVYDQGGEQELLRSLLTQKATGNLGPGYALVGNIMLNPGNTTLNSNDLDLVVATKGVWVYQFTDAQKKNLLKHIAGKTSAEARTYLQSQTGVSAAKIDISNGGGTLPTDTTQITLSIQTVAGASGGSPASAPTVTTGGPGHGPVPTQTVTGFGMVLDGGGNGKG